MRELWGHHSARRLRQDHGVSQRLLELIMNPTSDDDPLLNAQQSAVEAGISLPGFWRGVASGAFPKPNTVHFAILIAAVKSVRTVGSGVRGRSG